MPPPPPATTTTTKAFHEVSTDLADVPTCRLGTHRCNVYVSATHGEDHMVPDWGITPKLPYKTIQFALDTPRRVPGQTIWVMAGTYRNRGFGTGRFTNGPVANLDGVRGVKIKNYPGDRPLIQFDGSGGFVGGAAADAEKRVTDVEISGFEIQGISQNITHKEALSARTLKGLTYYSGKGIDISGGHHIYVHDMVVHDCPGSGIRMDSGDYLYIKNNTVFDNCWWSPAGESGIALAAAVHQDSLDEVKLVISGNSVHGNMNKIPYYNPTYNWTSTSIPNGLPPSKFACRDYPQCQYQLSEDCPWQCRYGRECQDFIIDGMGIIVTENKDTYQYGRVEISRNTVYKNGINGIFFHKTNRGVVKENVVYGNGVVPKDGKPEAAAQDWHASCKGRGRQAYSGLVIDSAEDVEVSRNAVAARYDDDFAFAVLYSEEEAQRAKVSQYDWEAGKVVPKRNYTGGDNSVCRGLHSLTPASLLHTAQICNDTRPKDMIRNKLECSAWKEGLEQHCNKNATWVARKYCRLSCHQAGHGYEGQTFCNALPDRLPKIKATTGQTCTSWMKKHTNVCNEFETWRAGKYCQASCLNLGSGYAGDDACLLSTHFK